MEIMTPPSPSKTAARAWRRVLRGAKPETALWAVLPGAAREGGANDALLASALGARLSADDAARWLWAADYRDAAQRALRRRVARWVWARVAEAARHHHPEAVAYEARPGVSVANSAATLGALWRRERHLLGRRARRSVERALAASLTGRRILAAAEGADEAAELYGRLDDGTPVYRGRDGGWYAPDEAAELLAPLRPWTRAEIVSRWREDAMHIEAARDWTQAVEAYIGAGGLGLPLVPPAHAGELERQARRLPLLVAWVAAQLGVREPRGLPELRPLDAADYARAGHHALLGLHDEERGDIALARGADDETLVHELVHWMLSVTGERTRRRLEHADEEALARRITDAYRRRLARR